MKDFLAAQYGIFHCEKKILEGKTCYKKGEYFYFITSSKNREDIYKEQAILAQFLIDQGYFNIAYPLQNLTGHWITNDGDQTFVVSRVGHFQQTSSMPHAEILAQFHKTGHQFPFAPANATSYGHWKQLWIEKVTWIEEKVIEEAKKRQHNYYRLLMNVLPYLVGIGENAIQYVQESEYETRFSESDQGTITFGRYDHHLLQSTIWATDLNYDHKTRDIAEWIRKRLLHHDEKGIEDAWLFMKEYQETLPLSCLGWRLLYARLVFPLHIFDIIEKGFKTEDLNTHYLQLVDILQKQPVYEQSLTYFMQVVEYNYPSLNIPYIAWLDKTKILSD